MQLFSHQFVCKCDHGQFYSLIKINFSLENHLTVICLFSQTSGEAQYVSDIPIQGGELYAAFVVSTKV